MAIAIVHTTVATAADDPTKEVNKGEWNASHTLTLADARLVGRNEGSAGAAEEISLGSGLTFTGNVLSASGGAGSGDVVGPASSVDSEVALFDSTTGKIIKRASGSGVGLLTAGVLSLLAYTPPTSFTPAITFGGGNTGITYTSQIGQYVRFGDLIFFQLTVVLSSKGSSTGNALITGLPVAANASFGNSAFSVRSQNLTGVSGDIQAQIVASANTISPFYSATGFSTQLANTHFVASTSFAISGLYLA